MLESSSKTEDYYDLNIKIFPGFALGCIVYKISNKLIFIRFFGRSCL